MQTHRIPEILCSCFVLTLGCLLLLLGSPRRADAKRHMTPEFAVGQTRPMSLVLLPPHADFIKRKAVMTEEMVAECKALEEAAAQAVVTDLRGKGYEVRLLTVEEINADPELRELVNRVNDRYQEEWSKIVRKPRGVRTGRYSLGEETVQLATLLGVEGVLLSRIQAVGITPGRAVLASLFGGQVAGYGRLDLSVVEGGQGAVLAYFFSIRDSTVKDLVRRPEFVMQKACKKGLKKYPLPGEVIRTAGTDLGAEDEKTEEPDIVEEFEALVAPRETPEEPPGEGEG